MNKKGEIYINGRPIGCITKQLKITPENPAPIGQDTHYEITAEKIKASFAGEMMSKELRAKIEEFERSLPENLIKQFYESHKEWFGDMPYPVAYELARLVFLRGYSAGDKYLGVRQQQLIILFV